MSEAVKLLATTVWALLMVATVWASLEAWRYSEKRTDLVLALCTAGLALITAAALIQTDWALAERDFWKQAMEKRTEKESLRPQPTTPQVARPAETD